MKSSRSERVFIPKKKLDQIRVVGIAGSLRGESRTRFCVETALEGAKERGAETQLIDLRKLELGFCGSSSGEGKDVPKLRKLLTESHGVILGSPEYHGSISGVLKNALDWMGFEEFEGKMIGLVGVAGGQMGAVGALSTMRTIGRVLHGWVIPQQASVANVSNEIDEKGAFSDSKVKERVLEVGRQVARFSSLHNMEEAAQFLASWEESTPNPGGGS